MKIAGTGLSGLVGSRIVQLLTPRHTFDNWSLETGVDITDKLAIHTRIAQTESSWVLHLAAYTDVQNAEKEKILGENSVAWKVNVQATQHIVDACVQKKLRLLYVDTDYAFDGKKKDYDETDIPNPLSWYGKTKSEGARRVLDAGGLVVRIANPYRAHPVGKTDFVHKMLERLKNNQEIIAPSDQIFVPTFIDDIAVAIEQLMIHNATGIFHVVGSQALSPYDAAKIIAKTFNQQESLVKQTTFDEYFSMRASVPQYAHLRNDKIQAMHVSMHTFESGLLELLRQELDAQS